MGCMLGSPKQKTVAATLYSPGRTPGLFLALAWAWLQALSALQVPRLFGQMHCWSKAAETGGFGADWLGPPHRRLVL